MFRFAERIKAIKKNLKQWSATKFTNYRVQIEKNTAKLQYVETKLLESPNSHRLNNWHFRLIKQREKLLLFFFEKSAFLLRSFTQFISSHITTWFLKINYNSDARRKILIPDFSSFKMQS